MIAADLGITPEEMRELILERAADKIAAQALGDDYDGDIEARAERKIREALEAATAVAVDKAIAAHVDPFISGELEKIVFQRTNEWGEKKGEPQSFREYIIARADAYLAEPVSYDGKTRAEAGGFSWNKSTTRVAFMLDKHLQYHIESAMKAALADANSKIAGGLLEAVKHALAEASTKLKVAVTTK